MGQRPGRGIERRSSGIDQLPGGNTINYDNKLAGYIDDILYAINAPEYDGPLHYHPGPGDNDILIHDDDCVDGYDIAVASPYFSTLPTHYGPRHPKRRTDRDR
jgi:hypothetical protein